MAESQKRRASLKSEAAIAETGTLLEFFFSFSFRTSFSHISRAQRERKKVPRNVFIRIRRGKERGGGGGRRRKKDVCGEMKGGVGRGLFLTQHSLPFPILFDTGAIIDGEGERVCANGRGRRRRRRRKRVLTLLPPARSSILIQSNAHTNTHVWREKKGKKRNWFSFFSPRI